MFACFDLFLLMHFQDAPCLGLWRTDFETGQTHWSREMFLIYGLQPESSSPSVEILMKYLHRDDRDLVSNTIHQATKSLTEFSFFYRIVRKDRSTRNLYSMGRFEKEFNGKATCRHGICLDITGLSKADLNEITSRLSSLALPPLAVLLKLDPQDNNMASLLDIAATLYEKMRSRISNGNSPKSAFT